MKCFVCKFLYRERVTHVGGFIGYESPVTLEKTARARGLAWPVIYLLPHACGCVYAPTPVTLRTQKAIKTKKIQAYVPTFNLTLDYKSDNKIKSEIKERWKFCLHPSINVSVIS